MAAALALAASSTLAAPCAPGSFASYSALGAGGCQIGTATALDFTAYAALAGANGIPLTNVTIIPREVDATTIGFDFTTPDSFAGGFHNVRDFMLGYQLQGASFAGETVLVSGVELVGDGSSPCAWTGAATAASRRRARAAAAVPPCRRYPRSSFAAY